MLLGEDTPHVNEEFEKVLKEVERLMLTKRAHSAIDTPQSGNNLWTNAVRTRENMGMFVETLLIRGECNYRPDVGDLIAYLESMSTICTFDINVTEWVEGRAKGLTRFFSYVVLLRSVPITKVCNS